MYSRIRNFFSPQRTNKTDREGSTSTSTNNGQVMEDSNHNSTTCSLTHYRQPMSRPVQPDQIYIYEGKPNRFHHTIHDGIKKVCSTSGGTFILSWSGKVYGLGSLGGVTLSHFCSSWSSSSSTSSDSPQSLLLFDTGGFQDKIFTDIVGGNNVLFLFSTDRQLFAVGQNDYALTGQPSPTSMTSLTRIVTFLEVDEYPVLATICFSSSLVYTSKNRVFVMGQTSWFLGVSNHYMPLTYKSDRRIVSMSGAYFHANMLDEDGRVYVCGEQSSGFKLGVRETTIRDLVPLDTIQERVVIAHCAINHSIFVTESQRVLLCGYDLPGKRYNDIPFLLELVIMDRVPMTIVTHVSSAESRVIVSTNYGVYSNESVGYNPHHYETGSMTSELKRIPNALFERGFEHFGLDMNEAMKSSCASHRVAFYTASDSGAVTVSRAFPRLFSYTSKMVLTNVEIITQM